MTKVRCNLSISLDGFLSGPNQSLDNPLGVGGEQLHDWAFALAAFHRLHSGADAGEVNASTQIVEEHAANVGAVIMGRNMFGGGPGPWRSDPPWNRWWGDDPPFHRLPSGQVVEHVKVPG